MGMEHRVAHSTTETCPEADRAGWVRESRFGRWFLGTDIWRKYVLAEALDTLVALAGGRAGRGGHILDIGCGQGTAAPLLDGHFRPGRITGIDIDSELITDGRALSADWPLSAELVLTEGCATALPLEDASVDLVLCHQLLHHMVAQRRALAEMRRVLRPGGLLLVAESCRCFIESSLVRALFRHPGKSQRTAAGYVGLVRDAGFRLDDQDIVTETPWWSLPDMGLLGRVQQRTAAGVNGEPTEVLMVAERTR